MSSMFDIVQLGTVATIKGGKRLPLGEEFSVEPTAHPYIRARDLNDSVIVLDDPVYLMPHVVSKLSRYTVSEGDVCITIVGANVGETGVVPKKLSGANLTENAVKVVHVVGKAEQAFLRYALLTPNAKAQMKVLAGGAAQPKLGIYKIETLEIPCPPVLIQRQIASILSAYDDLIENNTRRIALLEEMARKIYEEWFVHFRFPGHEQAKMVESDLGVIPENWQIMPVTQAIAVNPTVRVPKDGMKAFVPMGCLSNDSLLITGVEEREGNSGSKFQNGDTLFARITPCLENGKTGYVQFLPDVKSVAFGSTEFIVLRSKSVSPEYVYLLARSDAFRANAIKSMSGATGRQRVKEACFESFLIAQPDADTLGRFQQIISPMFAMIETLQKKITNLRKTRDLLLPKLISGELDVSSLPEPILER